MAEIDGVGAVIKALGSIQNRFKDDMEAVGVVGYTANYAPHVHEDVEAWHADGKQAKFLEDPARRLRDQIGRMIQEDLKAGKSMKVAILRACLFLQRESMKICPVDTGNLRASAFSRVT